MRHLIYLVIIVPFFLFSQKDTKPCFYDTLNVNKFEVRVFAKTCDSNLIYTDVFHFKKLQENNKNYCIPNKKERKDSTVLAYTRRYDSHNNLIKKSYPEWYILYTYDSSLLLSEIKYTTNHEFVFRKINRYDQF